MNLLQKMAQLNESIKLQAQGRTSSEDSFIKVHMEEEQFPYFWFEIENPESEDFLPFSYYAKESSEADCKTLGQGKLLSVADGFKIQGLVITQPLASLSPTETGNKLLLWLGAFAELSIEQATEMLTGHK